MQPKINAIRIIRSIKFLTASGSLFEEDNESTEIAVDEEEESRPVEEERAVDVLLDSDLRRGKNAPKSTRERSCMRDILIDSAPKGKSN